MKIVFFGTPDYVVPILDTLHKEFKTKLGESPFVAIVTQSPKPIGRSKEITYSPVDNWAHKKVVVKYFSPLKLLSDNIQVDLGILASYGAIIPQDVINLFPHGILNIHPSLLPIWRGSSPVQATIISENQAGASIIKIDEKLDHGPIISQFRDEVLPDDTTETLRNRLYERSAEVLTTLIPSYLAGKVKARKQDDSKATFTREIKKSDGFIPPKYINAIFKGQALQVKWKIDFMNDYSLVPSVHSLNNFIRAMQPWPVAWTEIKLMVNNQWSTKRLKIIKTHLEKSTINHQLLAIDTVQLEGKNPVSWKQFKEGYEFMFE